MVAEIVKFLSDQAAAEITAAKIPRISLPKPLPVR
jgi:hypothetical protein